MKMFSVFRGKSDRLSNLYHRVKGGLSIRTYEVAPGPDVSAAVRHGAPEEVICPSGIIAGQARGECEIAGRRFAYGLQVGFEPSKGAAPRHAGVRAWALDVENNIPSARLCISTENGAIHTFEPRDPRADVLNQLGIEAGARPNAIRCGYSGLIPNAGASITFALEVAGEKHVLTTGYPEAAQVLIGRNGWLFLAGDSNNSPGQFTGDHQPSTAWSAGWDAYFAGLGKLAAGGTGGQVCFVIVPSKESIFPDYYPLARGPCTPMDSLMKRYGSAAELFNAASVLERQRELSYDRAETHWTDFGARLVCQEITHHFGLHNPPLPLNFAMPFVSGDLGWKTVPPVRTHRPVAQWPNASRVIFDNFVLHHGRIRVTENTEARCKQTYVIFGGSSAEAMERYLTAVYRRVVYVYSAGAWDAAILEHEKPDFTILQSAERFLTRAPTPGVDNAAIVARKIRDGHLIRHEPREEVLAQWTDPSVAIYRNMG